jgi:hypothetical protein
MSPRKPLPPDAVVLKGNVEPLLVNGGHVVKSLSLAFLADLQEDWIKEGKKIFPVLRDKHPQAYFGGLVALAKMIRWRDTYLSRMMVQRRMRFTEVKWKGRRFLQSCRRHDYPRRRAGRRSNTFSGGECHVKPGPPLRAAHI